MVKDSDFWLGKISRSKQIYKWFNDVAVSNNLTFFYRDINDLLLNNEIDLAVNRFNELLSTILSRNALNENGDTLAYLIDKNIRRFGRKTITLDLFNGVITTKFRIKKVTKKAKIKNITSATLTEVIEETKTQGIKRFGLNTQGKREEVNIRIRSNGSIYLQSKKTGRILKQTKAFRKEVLERKNK